MAIEGTVFFGKVFANVGPARFFADQGAPDGQFTNPKHFAERAPAPLVH